MTDALRNRAERAAAAIADAVPAARGTAAFLQIGEGFDLSRVFDEQLGELPHDKTDGLYPTTAFQTAPPRFAVGHCGERTVLVSTGARYVYEGLGTDACVLPLYAAFLLGVRNAVLVDTAVSVREDVRSGTWLVLTDFVDRLGVSPLAGHPDCVPDPFCHMNDACSQSLNAEIINAAARYGMTPRLGIYQADPGPQCPTPADVECARRLGVDVLGYGLVPELIFGAALGCRLTALTVVAGPAPGYHWKPTQRAEHVDAAQFCSRDIMDSLRTAFADPYSHCLGSEGALPVDPEPDTDTETEP